MTTLASPPPLPPNMNNSSPGPAIPSPGTIARRGRRPALIPYSADLSAYISATSSSSSPSFHISPFGTILGATFNPPLSSSTNKAPLFVLPPSLPDGGNPNTTKPTWRERGGADDSPFGWASEDEVSDDEPEMVNKGRKRAMTASSTVRKARLRRSLLLGSADTETGKVDIDVMDVDEEERKEVEGDVFSWVNSSSPIDDFPSTPLPNLASLGGSSFFHPLSKNHLQPNRPRKLNIDGENSGSGTWTVPTSPMSGTFGPDLELQRKRLEEAGLGIESIVRAGIEAGMRERLERKS